MQAIKCESVPRQDAVHVHVDQRKKVNIAVRGRAGVEGETRRAMFVVVIEHRAALIVQMTSMFDKRRCASFCWSCVYIPEVGA